MKKIAIIGAGKVGTSIGYALKKKGYTITSVSCSSLASAKESTRIIGQGQPSVNTAETARLGEVVFITVPDDRIAGVVSELKTSDICWTGKTVFHCSGLHPAGILKPLKDKGASTASFHPIQSFSEKTPHIKTFRGISFGLEGGKKALLLARSLVLDLGGRPLTIQSQQKPLYHAACSISSNFLVVLLDTAVALFKAAGLEENQALAALLPLVGGTLENLKNQGTGPALTGPVIRGDEKTLRTHLEALKAYPEIKELYGKMANRALSIAQTRAKLAGEEIKAVSRILEEK
jgi:predicted short-subunit dehydrogenase-like oxidoreductase (DUF2520 family)